MAEKSRATTLSQKNRVTHKARVQTAAKNPRKTSKDSAAPVPARRKRGPAPVPDADTRQRMIAIAAYYKAEKRGFASHDPEAPRRDWMEAEAEIERFMKTFGMPA